MGRTVVFGRFEWDEQKAQANIRKHGISFEEATSVFNDPHLVQLYDEAHSSQDEERIKGIGIIKGLLVVATIFTERDRKRIISARQATKQETEYYYEQNFRDS